MITGYHGYQGYQTPYGLYFDLSDSRLHIGILWLRIGNHYIILDCSCNAWGCLQGFRVFGVISTFQWLSEVFNGCQGFLGGFQWLLGGFNGYQGSHQPSSFKIGAEFIKLKLHDLGLNKHILQWITSYLCDRHQLVVMEGASSEPTLVVSGAPQGSILEPLLLRIKNIKNVTRCRDSRSTKSIETR